MTRSVVRVHIAPPGCTMSTIPPYTKHIPGYSPAQVFGVGTLVETLPEPHGFTLEVDSDRFAENVIVRLQLLLPGHDFLIPGRVTEFIENEHVKINGSSHVGKAAVWLDLFPDEEINGTRTELGIEINHSWK